MCEWKQGHKSKIYFRKKKGLKPEKWCGKYRIKLPLKVP